MTTKTWWEPVWDEEQQELNWLCDHVGEAEEKMDALWGEILDLRATLIEAIPSVESHVRRMRKSLDSAKRRQVPHLIRFNQERLDERLNLLSKMYAAEEALEKARANSLS